MLLSLKLALLLSFLYPLFFEHLLLKISQLPLLLFDLSASILLPITDSHGVSNPSFFLIDFLALLFVLCLEIKLPELCINMLLHDLLVNVLLLVHELLLALHLALVNEELALLLSQIVSG